MVNYTDTNADFIVSSKIMLIPGNSALTTVILNLQGDNSNLVYGSATLNCGYSQGQSLTMNKADALQVFPLPFLDTDKTLGFDTVGVKRDFAFNGVVTADSQDCITRFIYIIQLLINGNQMVTVNGTLGSASNLDFKLNKPINTSGNFVKSGGGSYNNSATFASQIPVNPISVMFSNCSYTYNAAQECQLNYSLQFTQCYPNFN